MTAPDTSTKAVAEAIERLREGRSPGSPFRWNVTPSHIEAADLLSALMRERDEARSTIAEIGAAVESNKTQILTGLGKLGNDIAALKRRAELAEAALAESRALSNQNQEGK